MSEEAGTTIFELVGEDAIAQVVAAFYRRAPADDVIGPMYPPQDLAGSEQRLRDFLVYRLGGPPRYIEERGHPRLRRRHAPFAIGQTARDRWVLHMEAALDEVRLPPAADGALRPFFADVATFLINRATEPGPLGVVLPPSHQED